jgi:5'/3'-nucleotidase SurE
MRILGTNDDGINAPGLVALEAIAAELSDDVWVVAPAEEQSGAGHSLTLSQPVRLRERVTERVRACRACRQSDEQRHETGSNQQSADTHGGSSLSR